VELVRFLLSPEGQALVRTAGFRPGTRLVGGEDAALPAELRPLVLGSYR
jgi:hypothetical protein